MRWKLYLAISTLTWLGCEAQVEDPQPSEPVGQPIEEEPAPDDDAQAAPKEGICAAADEDLACVACIKDGCCSELEACLGDDNCACIAGCLAADPDNPEPFACVEACGGAAELSPTTQAFAQCILGECQSLCQPQ